VKKGRNFFFPSLKKKRLGVIGAPVARGRKERV
jgi:hypothetical protein